VTICPSAHVTLFCGQMHLSHCSRAQKDTSHYSVPTRTFHLFGAQMHILPFLPFRWSNSWESGSWPSCLKFVHCALHRRPTKDDGASTLPLRVSGDRTTYTCASCTHTLSHVSSLSILCCPTTSHHLFFFMSAAGCPCTFGWIWMRISRARQQVKGANDNDHRQLAWSLRFSFRLLGLASLLLAPLLIVYHVAVFSFRNSDRASHGALATRTWTPFARWRLREYCEVEHYFQQRYVGVRALPPDPPPPPPKRNRHYHANTPANHAKHTNTQNTFTSAYTQPTHTHTHTHACTPTCMHAHS